MNIKSRLISLALALACASMSAEATSTALAASNFISAPAQFRGRVVGVADGDTLSVLQNGIVQKVRLHDIDCPEKKQPFGERARQFTSRAAFNKEVQVVVTGTDLYGRCLGEVLLPDKSSLNTMLVRQGLAWVYKNRSKDPARLQAQLRAKSSRRGLWKDKAPIPPWEFRKHSRQAKWAKPDASGGKIRSTLWRNS